MPGACLHKRGAWLMVGCSAAIHMGHIRVLCPLGTLHIGLACVGGHNLVPCMMPSGTGLRQRDWA